MMVTARCADAASGNLLALEVPVTEGAVADTAIQTGVVVTRIQPRLTVPEAGHQYNGV